MDDRTLLEDAARAAGHTLRAVIQYEDESSWYGLIASGDGYSEDFDPLNDDGDALRLAVACGLAVIPYPIYPQPKHSVIAKVYKDSAAVYRDEEKRIEQIEVYGSDPAAATRRAIVRAAAAIGRQMRPPHMPYSWGL